MSIVVVTSEEQGAGKTGVAAAIARHIGYEGRPVRLLRVEGPRRLTFQSSVGHKAPAINLEVGPVGNAELDAKYFGSLSFAPGSPSAPVKAASVENPKVGTYVVEVEMEASMLVDASTIILVARPGVPAKLPEEMSVQAVVVVAPEGDVPASIDGVPVVPLPADRTLAGFSVSEARSLLDAEVLVEGDLGDPTCDHLVIAPISSDAGQPYLNRFESKTVVCRFDKTDAHLAALRSEVNCLILTGGGRPSDYLFDAASSRGVPVLLSSTDTENTVMVLEDVFTATRFQGERKLARMAELLESSPVLEVLG